MWRRGLTELAHGLAQLLYPHSCPICDTTEVEDAPFRDGLCGRCRDAVTSGDHAVCSFCAATVGPHVSVEVPCPACRSRHFGFDRAIRLGIYDGPLRDAVLRMKHQSGESLAEILGRIAARQCVTQFRLLGSFVVIPVPLHWSRRWQRGYNQADAVAHALARTLRMEYRPNGLRRLKAGAQHAQSTAAARRQNMKGAFWTKSNPSWKGRCILLVDDVMTTGSTASEAARTLKAAGADSVIAFVLARR